MPFALPGIVPVVVSSLVLFESKPAMLFWSALGFSVLAIMYRIRIALIERMALSLSAVCVSLAAVLLSAGAHAAVEVGGMAATLLASAALLPIVQEEPRGFSFAFGSRWAIVGLALVAMIVVVVRPQVTDGAAVLACLGALYAMHVVSGPCGALASLCLVYSGGIAVAFRYGFADAFYRDVPYLEGVAPHLESVLPFVFSVHLVSIVDSGRYLAKLNARLVGSILLGHVAFLVIAGACAAGSFIDLSCTVAPR